MLFPRVPFCLAVKVTVPVENSAVTGKRSVLSRIFWQTAPAIVETVSPESTPISMFTPLMMSRSVPLPVAVVVNTKVPAALAAPLPSATGQQ